MKYYKNSSIPVDRFFGFLETRNHKLLLKKKKKLNLGDKLLLDKVFTDIFYEYCYLSQDDTLLKSFKEEIKKDFLTGQINCLTQVLDLYSAHGEIQVLELLPELGVPFNAQKEIEPQVKKAISKIKGLRNKFNLINSKKKKEDKDSDYNLEEQAANIEIALELKYSIDTSEIKLSKWVALIKLIKQRKNG